MPNVKKKGEKEEKTKESVMENSTNDSCFTLVLSPKGWLIRAVDARLQCVQKSPGVTFWSCGFNSQPGN